MNSLTRKILIFVLVLAVVGGAGWYGRKAYKRCTERNLVAKGRQYLEKKDLRNAVLSVQRALQVNPMSPEATALWAEVLEFQGVPTALNMRIRAAQLAPTKPEFRLAWAKTAIKLNMPDSARQALDGLDEKDKYSAEYHKNAGALAWARGDRKEAEGQYHAALKLEPNSPTVSLNLAAIHVSSTNAAIAAAGRAVLEQMSTNAELHIAALRLLQTEAIARTNLAAAASCARRIAESTEGTFPDYMSYLELLRASKAPEFASTEATLKQRAATNAANAFALGRWMAMTDSVTNALRWLQTLPASIQTNQPATVLIADCLVELQDWKAMLAWTGKQNWGDFDYYRCAIEALAQKSLRQDASFKLAWRKTANLSSHRLDRLSRLVQLTGAWGWDSERTDLLREIVADSPREKWAANLLLEHYYKAGNTRAMADLLTKSHAADPADPNLKNNLANISLLRKLDLDNACRLAHEAYDSSPENPFFASTYAYSLLLQKKPDEASKIISGVKTNFLQIPSVAAYYGVVQVRSGHKDLAREPLKLAAQAALLPEEKELVKSAQSQL